MCYNEADFIAEVHFRMDQLTIERQAPVTAQYDAVVCGGIAGLAALTAVIIVLVKVIKKHKAKK